MIGYARLLGIGLFVAGIAAAALWDGDDPAVAPPSPVEKHADRLASWPYRPGEEDGAAQRSVRRIAPDGEAAALRSAI